MNVAVRLVAGLYKWQIIVAGDFNIHVEYPNDKDAAKLNDILLNFVNNTSRME